VKYIQKNSGNGPLEYRRSFPAALRGSIPGSPSQLKRSLKAASLDQPGAMQRYSGLNAEYDRIVAAAIKTRDCTYDTLDASQIASLVAVFERDWRTAADVTRWHGTEDRKDRQNEGINWFLDDFRNWQADGDKEEVLNHWQESATALLEGRGLVLDPVDATSLERLCIALNGAAIGVCEAIERGTQHEGLDQPLIAPPASQSPPSKHQPDGEGFGELVARLIGLDHLAISPSVQQETRTALRFFEEAFGKVAVTEISRKMVSDWMALLAKRPAQLPRPERHLPLREIVKRYEDRADVPRLAPQTFQGRVTCLAKRWDQLKQVGWVSLAPGADPNPFRGHPMARKTAPKTTKGMSQTELAQMFALPIFTAGERPKGGKGEACYWLPLILLMTGARPEEVAQMLVSDIWQDASDIWMLRYTDTGVHPEKGQQTLKTDGERSGRRNLPVPERLLDLGLLKYHSHLKAAGELALFPALRTKGKRNLLFSAFGDWWSPYVRAAGVLPKGRRAARELRHVWATAAREAQVPKDAMEYVMGHSDGSGNSNSDYGDRQALGEYMHKVDPKGPDWSKVIAWKPR